MIRRTAIVTAAVAAVVAASPAAAQQPSQDLRSPDRRDPAPAFEPRTYTDLRSADARDGRRVETVPAPPRTIVESGFDPGDAAIGAGALVALLSLSGGIAVVTRRHRGRGERASVPVAAR